MLSVANKVYNMGWIALLKWLIFCGRTSAQTFAYVVATIPLEEALELQAA